jgi:IS5 family transposase
MLVTIRPEMTLWDSILPESARGLPRGLAEVDGLLDDGRFFEPFVAFFSARTGRPSIPMETYIRMMVLKYRYGLGFETLCAEVADSLAWRRFCRIPLGEAVPHPSTLEKITTRVGEVAIAGLNEKLLEKAAEAKLVRCDRMRSDTTVLPANVAYPSDAGLLAKGVRRVTRLVGRLQAAGLARRTRSMARRAHGIGAWLRRRSDEAKDEVMAITAEMVTIAAAAALDAAAVAANSRRALRRQGNRAAGSAKATLAALERDIAVLEAVIAQTKVRVAGKIPDGSKRVVSFHDPDARPIAKGRLGKPVEFGYKVEVTDNTDGVIVDHRVHQGNPPDAPMLAPAIARIKARFGRSPSQVTADRGYGQADVDADLEALGVKYVAIPRKGRPNAERRQVERSTRFVKLVKWRTGSEGRIAALG